MSDALQAPQIYTYHPETFEYVGAAFAELSPKDYEEGCIYWVYPAYSTNIAPPDLDENHAIIFDDKTQTWNIIDDYRGQIWYDKNGQEKNIDFLGDPKSHGLSADKPTPPLPTTEDLLVYSAQKRYEKEVGGIVVSGIAIATDDRSKLMITGARTAAESNPAFTTEWKTADGQSVTLNAIMIVAISDAVLKHISDCFVLESEVSEQIRNGKLQSFQVIDETYGVQK